jgi:DNA-binding transcriptional MerR regulator
MPKDPNQIPAATYIPFSAAAYCAEVDEKRIRNWMDRKSIRLDANAKRVKGRYRRFSELDVIRLAIISRLSKFGLTADEASHSVEEVFRYVLKGAEYPKDFEGSEEDRLIGGLKAYLFIAHWDKNKEKWIYTLQNAAQPESDLTANQDTRLICNISRIVNDIYGRLEELYGKYGVKT